MNPFLKLFLDVLAITYLSGFALLMLAACSAQDVGRVRILTLVFWPISLYRLTRENRRSRAKM